MFEVMSYDSSFGEVKLTPQTIKNYLVKGNAQVSDQEVVLFAEMCKAQKLNPFVTGEVYLIKFGDKQPAQMVVGYDTYKRRAEENPQYLFKKSGIVVQRGADIIKKEGACLYPSETLIGGWCEVHKNRNGVAVSTYKEVSMKEYDKGNSMWKEKPSTMIEKVAISQALREAFPKDFEGMYTAEEVAPAEYEATARVTESTPTETKVADTYITQEERQGMFDVALQKFGKEAWKTELVKIIEKHGYKNTTGIVHADYEAIMDELKVLPAFADDTVEETVEEKQE